MRNCYFYRANIVQRAEHEVTRQGVHICAGTTLVKLTIGVDYTSEVRSEGGMATWMIAALA